MIEPYFDKGGIKLFLGKCEQLLPQYKAELFHAAVTDPPYELGFMGKAWDSTGIAYSVPMWAQVLRVLRPGGYLEAFGGTRTCHRMVCAIEDTGFEIRDQIDWWYATGFPKALDAAKALAKASPGDAAAWEGWKTALKPAHEPVCLARKPLSEKSVALNIVEHGTGCLNIDGCRIAGAAGTGVWGSSNQTVNADRTFVGSPDAANYRTEAHDLGRYPSNLIMDEEVAEILDAQSGITTSGATKRDIEGYPGESATGFLRGRSNPRNQHGDTGGASRFFYVAKASKNERNAGLDHLEARSKVFNGQSGDSSAEMKDLEARFTTQPAPNDHPTVKPVMLMRYLCRLVTPPGGVLLDPFCGTATTLVAAVHEGFRGVGIEQDEHALEIAVGRIEHALSERGA